MTLGAQIDSPALWLNQVRQAFEGLGELVSQAEAGPDDGAHATCADSSERHEPLRQIDEGLKRLGEWVNVTDGLSAALIQAYEQLNILYDITHQAARFASSRSLLLYAVSRLAQALGSDLAGCVDPQELTVHLCEDSGASGKNPSAPLSALPDHVQEHVRRAISGKVPSIVLTEQHGPVQDNRTWLIRRVGEGKHLLGVAVFARAGEEYGTPELSLSESALAHTSLTLQNVKLNEELRTIAFEVVRALVRAIDKKDSYTAGHSERVAEWAAYIGEAMELGREQVEMLRWGGLLHDVGKIGIRDEVLIKPGRLTDEEFTHIKLHPVMSYDILEPIARMKPILHAVRHHHESWDGAGYPDRLAGEAIPLPARVVQVADVFDALTSTRSYRQAYTVEQALQIMRQDAGQRLDPHLVPLFSELVERAKCEQPSLFVRPRVDVEEPSV